MQLLLGIILLHVAEQLKEPEKRFSESLLFRASTNCPSRVFFLNQCFFFFWFPAKSFHKCEDFFGIRLSGSASGIKKFDYWNRVFFFVALFIGCYRIDFGLRYQETPCKGNAGTTGIACWTLYFFATAACVGRFLFFKTEAKICNVFSSKLVLRQWQLVV